VIIPVPATIVACWAAARFAPSLREKGGWRGSVSMLLDSIRLARRLFERPTRYWLALGGMAVFWATDMFAVWAGLAAFGFAMDPAALVVGFCTGMVFTRRMAPMAGAGMLTLALSAALWYCGVPLPVAICLPCLDAVAADALRLGRVARPQATGHALHAGQGRARPPG
jgi:hypothetical protein